MQRKITTDAVKSLLSDTKTQAAEIKLLTLEEINLYTIIAKELQQNLSRRVAAARYQVNLLSHKTRTRIERNLKMPESAWDDGEDHDMDIFADSQDAIRKERQQAKKIFLPIETEESENKKIVDLLFSLEKAKLIHEKRLYDQAHLSQKIIRNQLSIIIKSLKISKNYLPQSAGSLDDERQIHKTETEDTLSLSPITDINGRTVNGAQDIVALEALESFDHIMEELKKSESERAALKRQNHLNAETFAAFGSKTSKQLSELASKQKAEKDADDFKIASLQQQAKQSSKEMALLKKQLADQNQQLKTNESLLGSLIAEKKITLAEPKINREDLLVVPPKKNLLQNLFQHRTKEPVLAKLRDLTPQQSKSSFLKK